MRLSLLLTQVVWVASSYAGGRRHDASWQPDYVLEITAQNYTISCQMRYSTLFNGTSPGPTLYMKEGHTTWVRVYNNLQHENTTTHWHGLSQRTAPFSDGTPLGSQWPIAPGEFFDYEVTPEIGDAGTYFYHSHVSLQAISAHGPIIVEDADTPPYNYDGDKTLLLADFYAANDSAITNGLLGNPFKWSGETQALVINGHSGNSPFSTARESSCAPYVIDVEPDKVYRMRFIGGTAISLISLGFEGHDNLTIIEADGEYTKPANASYLQVAPGQRFSILFPTKSTAEITATNQTQYWIRFENRERPANVSAYALLNYKLRSKVATQLPASLPIKSPVVLPSIVYNWLEYTLQSLKPRTPFPFLSQVTRTITIQMNQAVVHGAYINKTVQGNLQWHENSLPWQEEALAAQNFAPYLIDVYTNGNFPNYTAAVANYGWDPTTKAFPALVGEVIDIVWQSNSGPLSGFDIHPMHAHGEHYFDLGSGNGTYNATLNEQHFPSGYIPAKRDTTMLYRYSASSPQPYTSSGWRAWRISVTEDNVGVWMMHCHILQHMVMGMQTVWTFGTREQIIKELPSSPYIEGYLTYGGDAYGNSTFDPLVAHYQRHQHQ